MSIYSIPPAFVGIASFMLACFVISKNYRSKLHWAFSGTCFSTTFWLVPYALAYSTVDPALGKLFVRIACTSVVFFAPFLYHFVVAFLRLSEERHLLKVSYVVTAILFCGFIFTDYFLAGSRHYFFGYYSKAGPLHPIQVIATLVTWCRAGYLLRRELLKPMPANQRSKVKFVYFSIIVTAPVLMDFIPKYGFEFYPLGFLFASIYITLAAYGILKHQLMDIEIVFRKSLVYSLLIACITATYLVIVLVTERWFAGFMGYRSVLTTLVVSFLIAIFFNPLRDRIQSLIDRALFHATPTEMADQREQLLVEVRKGDQMKAVGTLAAGLAHEIKNPLASIKTFTTYLESKHDDPQFREKFQKIVGSEVDRINMIVQQLLEFAKPVPPKMKPLQITEVLDETIQFLNNDFMQRQISVQRSYEPAPQVMADPQQLKQVFLNLLLNSLQAMNGNGSLKVSTRQDRGEVLVTIQDNGQGITADHLPHIFDPFFTTKEHGTGLGLAVVHGIIKEHGGTIRVDSQPGKGARFTISLPAAL